MELVRQFSYDANGKLRAHLRVVENERADANGNKLMEISIHFDNGKGATLKEIGRELDISRERVRQIQDSAISKLIDFAYKKGIDYTGCGRILSGNEEKDAIGMDENHEKWKNPPKRDNFKQAYATPKSYWEIERDAETNPKKKR